MIKPVDDLAFRMDGFLKLNVHSCTLLGLFNVKFLKWTRTTVVVDLCGGAYWPLDLCCCIFNFQNTPLIHRVHLPS